MLDDKRLLQLEGHALRAVRPRHDTQRVVGKRRRRGIRLAALRRHRPEGNAFRLAGFRQDALIYTKDGKIPTQSADQALFVVSSAAREYVAPEKRAELALTEIRKVERGASLEIISQTDETIGGAPAVVITAKTKDKTPALIFQAALFHGQRVTMLVGIARGETDANLAYFQKLASTYAESPAAKNSAPAELMKRAAATGGRA